MSTCRAAGEGRATGLVVEDDDDLRTALTQGLESEGFTVIAVASASAALEVVGAVRPDLVLLDWWLSEGEQGAARPACPVTTSIRLSS